MGFGEDLLSTGYELFRFAEIVGERKYDCLDEITDKRIHRTIAASETVKGMLHGLHRHFHADAELTSALVSVKRITDYLLYSFQSALTYKLPYAEHNPFGLSVDISSIDNRKQCQVMEHGLHAPADKEFETLVLNTHRLVSMQMLMVHYFSIEFVILVAHIHGCRHSPILLDIASDDKFQALMRKLHKYQRAIGDMLQNTYRNGDFNEQGTTLRNGFKGVLDLDLTFIPNTTEINNRIENGLIKYSDHPLIHRQHSFNVLMMALDTYNPTANGKKLYKLTESMYEMLLPQLVCFPRRFMESNPRARLAKKFKTFTSDPCNEYQAKPTSQSAGGRDYILHKEGSQMDVQRRKVVKIWKHELKWAAADWETFTVVHGEAHMMANLMLALAPIVMANNSYRTNHEQDSSIMHSMLTRFYGPLYVIDSVMQTEAFKREMEQVPVIDEPTNINASSIQPMPTDIQKWAKDIHRVYGDEAEHHVSDAVFAPVLNLGVVNQLRKSNVRADQYNVRWLRLRTNPIQQYGVNTMKFINSMFLIHYGNALIALQPPHACHGTLKVLGATAEQPMQMDQVAYGEFNLIPPNLNFAAPVQYTHTSKMIADIMKLQLEFTQGFSQRGAGFLHPACWLNPETTTDENSPYVECDSQDITSGVRILLPSPGDAAVTPTDAPLARAMQQMNCEKVEERRVEAVADGQKQASSAAAHEIQQFKGPSFFPERLKHKHTTEESSSDGHTAEDPQAASTTPPAYNPPGNVV